MESDSKRAILAVILSGVVLFGWQYFFPTPAPVATDTETPTEIVDKPVNEVTNNPSLPVDSIAVTDESKLTTIEHNGFSYIINNNLELVRASSVNSDKNFPELFEKAQKSLYFKIDNKFTKIFFNITKINNYSYQVSNSVYGFNGTINIDDKGFLNLQLSSTKSFGYRFVTKSSEISLSNQQHNQYFIYSNDMKTYSVGDDDKLEAKVSWFGLDFKYHFMGTFFPENVLTKVELKESGDLIVDSIKSANTMSFRHLMVKKKYDDLVGLGNNLKSAIDFGIWEIIAVPILKGLQFFYSVFPNYGIAIILLTIFIRMLTFPLQYKSFKSMKKMQVIQPELKSLREKFKDDPQRMQKETMALFKREKANPVGGCLPMILQMPIFFAFYKVLYSAVELVDAPFYFWIKDLSLKDPYFVLPVLMAGAMFLNTKLTPTATADPAQQKIMMFMPLIFGFIMKDLPAGLTLYIFISTLMGMMQQLFVYKRVA